MTQNTPRIFKYNDKTFPDPGSEHSVETVRQTLIPFFPELTHCRINETTTADGEQLIEFIKQAATKG